MLGRTKEKEISSTVILSVRSQISHTKYSQSVNTTLQENESTIK